MTVSYWKSNLKTTIENENYTNINRKAIYDYKGTKYIKSKERVSYGNTWFEEDVVKTKVYELTEDQYNTYMKYKWILIQARDPYKENKDIMKKLRKKLGYDAVSVLILTDKAEAKFVKYEDYPTIHKFEQLQKTTTQKGLKNLINVTETKINLVNKQLNYLDQFKETEEILEKIEAAKQLKIEFENQLKTYNETLDELLKKKKQKNAKKIWANANPVTINIT